MRKVTVTEQDLINLAYKIANAHLAADRAALAKGETLDTDRPVGWLTGTSTVEDDIRGEWCDEDAETVEAALAQAETVARLVMGYYAS